MKPKLKPFQLLSRWARVAWVNKYFITAVLFVLWMAFFDKHQVSALWNLKQVEQDLIHEKQVFKEKIEQARMDKVDLLKNREKYAREKYLMHRPDEEIFIIEPQSKKE